jgi:ribonucleoside-diphosphate reductase alpha chain
MKKKQNNYDSLSEERKTLQEQGLVPKWYTTSGYQMFKDKYEYKTEGKSVRGQFERIAKSAAKYLSNTELSKDAEVKFFDLLWKGWLSPSTPVLANMGTDRALPVSCAGTEVQDSIEGFYDNVREVAILTKHGFGTASDLSGIRPRGSLIRTGGKANGVIPVINEHVYAMQNVSQGNTRRGAWAGYINIEHGDFDEISDRILNDPDDFNLGWILSAKFISDANQGSEENIRRIQRALKVKMVTGKGYFFFPDKVNAKLPDAYLIQGLTVKNSQLCNEITLYNDKDHTYTCILSSMNASKYNEWKDTDAVFWSTIFLDCVAEEFIQKAKNIPGLEKAVRFTEKSRALGLGQCGIHTLFMQNGIPFESYEAHMLSQEIQSNIWEKSKLASVKLAEIFGEPEWCEGTGSRNTHRLAIAPTKSTALLMGGISEGINPDPAMTYTQTTSAGEMDRINPVLLKLMKDKGVYTKKHIQEIVDNQGSVQKVQWLTPEEKEVFKTAFEINQKAILRLAAARGKYLDQWQSLNLFFNSDEDPVWIAEVHKEAFNNPDILGLYYVYSQAGVQASKGECSACN